MAQMKPRPVVVAVGTDEDIDAALEYAADEAERAGCGVHLVHVVHVVPTGPDQMLLDYQQVDRLGSATLHGALERAEDLIQGRVPLTSELIHGSAVPAIVDCSADARLVVLQRRDLSRMLRIVTTSVSSGVAARAHGPVVSVPSGWKPSETQAPLVTVGIDVPERGHAVLRAALEAAQARGATLRIVHRWWFPNAYDDLIMSRVEDETWSSRARAEIEAVLAPLREEFADVSVEIDVRHGRPADALIEASRHSLLVVVGRHDPIVPLGSHLGPVARAVLRESASPVLLAQPAGHAHRRTRTHHEAAAASPLHTASVSVPVD